jgi:hypothetical protein
MLNKNSTHRADIKEIFRTIKLYTCDNKIIYSLEDFLMENLRMINPPMICFISSSNDNISSIVEIVRFIFSNRVQLSFVFKNSSNIVNYIDFHKIESQLDLSNTIQAPTNDVYECAHRCINWDDGKKILINLNKSDLESVFIKKIRNNMRVNIFQLKIDHFNNILIRITNRI